MLSIDELATPCLLIDAEVLDRNVATMSSLLPGAQLRPHVKAHKCTALAAVQYASGHTSFTCATPREVVGMVDDAHHGKGIATLLLEHLAAVARSNGIERFTAQTLGDNRGMLTVFAKAGWPVHRRFDSGVIDVDFALADTAAFIDSVERREQRADSRAMARVLLATSIAVIGASDDPLTIGGSLWQRLAGDPRRRAYPVNPRHAEIGGVPAYAAITDIPNEVALAIVAVPADALAATIDQCVEKRVRGAVVVTSLDGVGGVDMRKRFGERDGHAAVRAVPRERYFRRKLRRVRKDCAATLTQRLPPSAG